MSDEGSIIAALNLGTAKAAVENTKGSPLEQVLTIQVNKIVGRLHASLDKYNVDASGALKRDTTATDVTISGNVVSVGISSLDYWKYVNYGVNGTLINNGAPTHGSTGSTWQQFEQYISKWITDKGITPEDGNDDRAYKSLNYAIRQSITKFGQKPRPFFDDVVNKALVEELRVPIENILKRSMEIIIVKKWQ